MNILKLITLNPSASAEPQTIPPAYEHPQRDVWTKFADLTLPDTLDALARKDTWPLPSLQAREMYHGERNFDYWASGLADAFRMVKMFQCWGDTSVEFGTPNRHTESAHRIGTPNHNAAF